jgi:argininosuccinate synthase
LTHESIVLAFNGNAASCAAVKWLIENHAAEVAAVIVDVGQTDDLDEVRARALSFGAVRAHIVDRCDAFALEIVMPAVASGAQLDEQALRCLPAPIIARAVADVAAIEGASQVACAPADDDAVSAFGRTMRALDPALRVLAAGRHPIERNVVIRPERHLLLRPSVLAATTAAHVSIGFESGIAVSVNGVAMGLRDLIESVSLIGGQYGVEQWQQSPALGMLQAAYRACGGRGTATVHLRPGTFTVEDEQSALVNLA